MKEELLEKELKVWKEEKKGLLIVSTEGLYTYSNSGIIKDYDSDFIILLTSQGIEAIKRSQIIKIKEVQNGNNNR